MESNTKRTKRSGKKPDVYRIITDRIIALLDAGTIPWRKTWKGGSLPKNLISNKAYRGVNVWLLGCQGFSSPYWLTFRQAKTLGGSVRKGEKGTPVTFWKILNKEETTDTGEKKVKKVFFLRYYTVFNLDQCDDVKAPKGRVEAVEPKETGGHLDFEANREACEKADRLFEDYVGREKISVAYGGTRAFYRITEDAIQVPDKDDFESAEDFHTTRFHEATHSTGTKKRCARDGIEEFDFFGSHQYADEELVAEFGATFLCAVTGIERDEAIENSAAYIARWKTKLEQDPKIVINAAQRAQKAADYILDETVEVQEDAGKEAVTA